MKSNMLVGDFSFPKPLSVVIIKKYTAFSTGDAVTGAARPYQFP
jgi:hypothetical protein